MHKNFDDLQHLLSCTRNNFDIIGVTEMLPLRSVKSLK